MGIPDLQFIPQQKYLYTKLDDKTLLPKLLEIPGAMLVPNTPLVGFPHNLHTVQWLMSLGVELENIPHPIDNPAVFKPAKLKGKYDPFEYQLETARYITMYKNSWILSKMGSGKTASCIWGAELLRATGELGKVIICCPISTINRVWLKEIFDTYPMRSVGIVTGTKAKKIAMLQREFDYYIINHDGLKQEYIMDEIKRISPTLIILDEATAMKTPGTARFKALKNIYKHLPYVKLWAVTATPAPNGPGDIWAIQTLVDARTVPPSLKAWKNTTEWKVDMYKWVPKPEAAELVKQAMWPAILFARDDIPSIGKPVEYHADLTPLQKTIFNQVKTEMIAEYKAEKDHTILAVNAAVKMSKLLQICSGNVYDINQDNVALPNIARLSIITQVLTEIGANTETKCIVFVPFKNAQREIHRFLTAAGYNTALVNGDVKGKERDEIFRRFEDEDEIRVLVAHPKVAAHGLTLIRASTIIWYGPFFSLELYEQGNGRIARIGQEQDLQLVHIGSHEIEWGVYQTLQSKGDNQNKVLAMYEQIINMK